MLVLCVAHRAGEHLLEHREVLVPPLKLSPNILTSSPTVAAASRAAPSAGAAAACSAKGTLVERLRDAPTAAAQ